MHKDSFRSKREVYQSVESKTDQTFNKTQDELEDNCFVNNKTTPIIPPLSVNNKIIPNFFEKANLFNLCFSV